MIEGARRVPRVRTELGQTLPFFLGFGAAMLCIILASCVAGNRQDREYRDMLEQHQRAIEEATQ